MKVFQSLYDRNKHIRSIMKKLGFSRPIDLLLESSRIVEYPWILRNIPSKGRILDIGSTGSQLPLMLAGLGYEVWTIDIREYEYAGIINNLNCIIGDIRETSFTDSFFDIILAVSTIEHIGLGRYGDLIDKEGDRNAMKEIRRIMSNDGILLMTVPFGKKYISKLHRVYDEELLLDIINKFKIENIEYFQKNNGFWIKSSKEKVKDLDSFINEKAIACVKARSKDLINNG